MTTYNGVEKISLHVTDRVTLSGVAAGGATVHDRGVLLASGVVSGPLEVQKGGTVSASGVISGSVNLRAGGSFDLTGVLSGELRRNDGHFTVAIGSIVHGRRVSANGALEATSTETGYITPETRRFRLAGTGIELTLE